MEIETKEKPHILHFQVKNIGFCQQSESFVKKLFYCTIHRNMNR